MRLVRAMRVGGMGRTCERGSVVHTLCDGPIGACMLPTHPPTHLNGHNGRRMAHRGLGHLQQRSTTTTSAEFQSSRCACSGSRGGAGAQGRAGGCGGCSRCRRPAVRGSATHLLGDSRRRRCSCGSGHVWRGGSVRRRAAHAERARAAQGGTPSMDPGAHRPGASPCAAKPCVARPRAAVARKEPRVSREAAWSDILLLLLLLVPAGRPRRQRRGRRAMCV